MMANKGATTRRCTVSTNEKQGSTTVVEAVYKERTNISPKKKDGNAEF